MKKIMILLFLLLLPKFVYAEDILLDELNVKNGEISLPFDPFNTEYTVTLEEEEFHLDFDYKVKDGITVSINNNHDLENDSMVTLTITKDDKKLDYHFYILKDTIASVATFNESNYVNENSFMFKYKIYIIPVTCLFLIFLVHRILFRKRKKHKK